MSYTILFTGGGSSGHVTPNLALIEKAQSQAVAVAYMGASGIEKNLIGKINIPYYEITSGKLRRQFKLKNFTDPFKVLWGTLQAFYYLGKIKPNLIFSKGGFVAVPVVLAGYLRRIPVIAHESDYTPGLANKICFPLVTTICVNYEGSKKFIAYPHKVVVTGSPVRAGFFKASREKALKFLEFSGEKPLLLITGGGLGSQLINNTIPIVLDRLCQHFHVVHLCGMNKLNLNIKHFNYRQYEYLHHEMYDVMVAADIVVSRAGANAVYELLTLKKLNILIPLSKKASRGDQLDNARFAEESGFSKVIQEESLTPELLLSTILDLLNYPERHQKALEKLEFSNAVENIWAQIVRIINNKI